MSAGSPSAPVVTVVSSTGRPSCTRVARAVAATLPCFSQLTSACAGSGRGARRKCALVAIGYGCGAVCSTARSMLASSTPAVNGPGDGEPVIRPDLVPPLPELADRGGLVEHAHRG